MSDPFKPKNHLLAKLSPVAIARLMPDLERLDLNFGDKVYSPGDVFSHVYFVEAGIVSLLADVDEFSIMELAIVGAEGMVALPVFLGVTTSNDRAIVQGKGIALRMKVADFLTECAVSDELPRVLRLFTYSLLMQIARSAACNRFHLIDARLARWLLMTEDRMGRPEFQITQEFLSYMLGVRREAVNRAATIFQRRKLISYSRGKMSIDNRAELEMIACDCYEFMSNSTVRAQPALT